VSKFNSDTNAVREASGNFLNFIATQGTDVIDNWVGAYENLDGTTVDLLKRLGEFRRANADGAKSVSIVSGEVEKGARVFRNARETLGGATFKAATDGVLALGKATNLTEEDVQRWVDAISGVKTDADLERVNKQIQILINQARAFGEAGIEGFQGEELQARLAEIAEFELILIEQVKDERKKAEEEVLADKRKKAEDAAAIEARENEKLRLQKQQADKEEFDRRIRQAQELNALSAQLLNESLTRGSAFFTDLQNQIKPLAAEIQLYEGLIANNLLSEEDLAGINGRIQTLRAGIEQLTVVSIQSGKALGDGFAETINTKVKEALNTYKTGVELAESVSNTFTNTLAGLFNDLVLGSKSASEAFKDFVRGLISGLVQAINQAIASKIVASILSSLVPGGAPIAAASGGVVSGSMGKPMTFAKGGIMAGAMMTSGLSMNAYAEGGVARGPQVAIFGEGKGAEAFVPLPGPNRGIPVEFKSMPSGGNIVVNFSPNISALDGASVRDLLVREGKVIGDIVASEIATGSNRGLTDIVRGRA
jgi:hypothetical protein